MPPFNSFAEFIEYIQNFVKNNSEFKNKVSFKNNIMLINGRSIDAYNIYRLAINDSENWEYIIISHIRNYMDVNYMSHSELPWIEAKSKIFPRIQPASILNNIINKEDALYIDFVNDTIICFVFDYELATVSLTKTDMIKWRTSLEEIEESSKDNMDDVFNNAVVKVADYGGTRVLVLDDASNSYNSACILAASFYDNFKLELGRNFACSIPCRDVLLAYEIKPGEYIQSYVNQLYAKQAFPICLEKFFITKDGIAGQDALQSW